VSAWGLVVALVVTQADEVDRGAPTRAVTRVEGLDGSRVVREVTTRVADKAALYGDPALVPTRAGERARQELALAAAVTAAVAARADVGALVVEVRLPAGADGGAVVVAGEVALAGEEVTRIAEAVVGSWSFGRVAVFVRSPRAGALAADGPLAADGSLAADGPRGPRGGDWRLVVALVGFGASAGIAVERLRRGAPG